MTNKKKIPITLAIAVVIILCGLISLIFKDVRVLIGLEKKSQYTDEQMKYILNTHEWDVE